MDSGNSNNGESKPKINRGVSPSIGGWGQFSRPGGSGVTRLGSFKQRPDLSLKNSSKPEFSPLIPSEKSKAKAISSANASSSSSASDKSKDGFISTPISVSSQYQQKLYIQQQRREQTKRQFQKQQQQGGTRFTPRPINPDTVKNEPIDENNDSIINISDNDQIMTEIEDSKNIESKQSENAMEAENEMEEEEKEEDLLPSDYDPWDPEDPVQLPMIDPKDPIGSIKAQKRNRLTATAANVDPSIAISRTGKVSRSSADSSSIPFHDKAGQIMSNELFFVQLPSQLPTKPPPLSVTAAAAASQQNQQQQQQQNMFEKIHEFEIPPFVGNLSDVEGLVGKLQIHKSGRVTLVLTNGVTFDVEQGMTPKICEDLFVLSKTSAQCIHMGDISGHVMIMPNTDSLGLTNSMKNEKVEK